MSKQIQLQTVLDTNRTSRISQRMSAAQQIQQRIHSRRKKQDTCFFILVLICEIITIFLSILLRAVSAEDKKWVYLTYIIMTFARGIVFVANSIKLIGFGCRFFQLYGLLDNVFVMMVGSIVTYIFLNYQSTVQFAIGAIICYPILLFVLCGNFRVMLSNGEWVKWQVISYKIVKIIGTTYFLVYGSYIVIADDSDNGQLLILWIFTTSAFWAEMCFAINTLDETDNLKTHYLIQDDE